MSTAPDDLGVITIDLQTIEECVQRKALVHVAAFSMRNAYLVEPAIALAILVLPVPGGPYKIKIFLSI